MSGQTPRTWMMTEWLEDGQVTHRAHCLVVSKLDYDILSADLSEAVAALKERDKLWCAAIIATQEAPGREPLTCDVQKLLAYFNSHKPPVQ